MGFLICFYQEHRLKMADDPVRMSFVLFILYENPSKTATQLGISSSQFIGVFSYETSWRILQISSTYGEREGLEGSAASA